MAKEIKVGSTDQTIDIFVLDSSATDGSGLTGLAYDTASLTCYYRIGATGTATQLSLATQTVGGAHSDGGFVEIDSTNTPGLYRLDLSDTMVGTAGTLKIYLHGADDMAPVVVEIEVVNVDKYDAVRGGMTALPNANADAAGGLPISDAGGLDIDTLLGRLDAAISSRAATGAEMDLVDAPNATAVAAIQSGLSTLTLAQLRTALGTQSDETITELSALDAEPTLADAVMLVYMMIRNGGTVTDAQRRINKDDGTALATGDLEDNDTTLTISELTV